MENEQIAHTAFVMSSNSLCLVIMIVYIVLLYSESFSNRLLQYQTLYAELAMTYGERGDCAYSSYDQYRLITFGPYACTHCLPVP